MIILRALFRILIGIVLGLATAIALSPALAAVFRTEEQAAPWLLWVVVLLCAVLTFFAPTIRRAFGRGFLTLGVATFALPISMMLLSGRVAGDLVATATTDAERAGAAIGAGLGVTVATGIAGFIGFFLGTVFLIIGLVLALGGRRDVTVTNFPPPLPNPVPVSSSMSERIEPRL